MVDRCVNLFVSLINRENSITSISLCTAGLQCFAQFRSSVVSDDCYPYRSGEMKKTGLCMIPRYKMLSSKVKCPSSKQENSPVYQTSPPYRIAPSEKEIMKEIIENGPVQGTLLFFQQKCHTAAFRRQKSHRCLRFISSCLKILGVK